ncbi:MAG: hypothetical protein ACI31V_05460 [Bacilli bacterium]
MKKKIIIPIIGLLILIIGTICLIKFNNRVVSTLTIDINPSIEIDLNRKDKVVRIKALNEDAKEIVNKKYNNKTLDETFNLLATDLIEKGYDNNMDVILYADGNIKQKEVGKQLEFIFGQNNIHTEIIVIEEVTKEDKELAKKYNISPAKASYIKTIVNENENINIDILVNKPVTELNETKRTGKYCDREYTLEGDWCIKEINREPAKRGNVCPEGYTEKDGICYEEVGILEKDNYVCRDEFTLKDDKCVRNHVMEATPSKYVCNSGVAKTRLELGLTFAEAGDANDIVCVDTSNGTHPVSPCETNDGTEYTYAGGTCYWHRAPVIASGCPGKIQVNGECWDDASNVLICVGARDGKRYNSRDEFCEDSIKYNDPIITEYKCEFEDAKLSGDKCIIEEIEDAQKERYCPTGYTKTEEDRCINKNNIKEKQDGYYCEDGKRLEKNECITIESIKAYN